MCGIEKAGGVRTYRIILATVCSILRLFVLIAFADQAWAAEPTVLDQFDNWRSRYGKASAEQQAVLVPEGVTLAQQRRVAMKDMLRLNPRYALERAIPAFESFHFPEAVAVSVERWVSGLGDIVMCPSNTPAAGISEDGLAREVLVGQEVFAGYVYGVRLVDQNFSKTPINGIVIDDQMAVAESPVRRLAHGEVSSLPVGMSQVVAQAGAETKVFYSESQVAQYE